MAWIVIWLADDNFVSFRSCTMEIPSRRLFPIYNHTYCFIDGDFQLVFVLGSSDSSVRGEPYRIFDIFFGRSASLGKCWSMDDDQSNEWSILICVTLTGPLENGKTILAPYVLITTFSFSCYYCWCLSSTKVLIGHTPNSARSDRKKLLRKHQWTSSTFTCFTNHNSFVFLIR